MMYISEEFKGYYHEKNNDDFFAADIRIRYARLSGKNMDNTRRYSPGPGGWRYSSVFISIK